jgi:prevent-host-death family protein
MTTFTAAEFNQRPSQVKRAARLEPVFITEHGRPAFVLLTIDDYERHHAPPGNLAEFLKMDDDIEFEIEPLGVALTAADLSDT